MRFGTAKEIITPKIKTKISCAGIFDADFEYIHTAEIQNMMQVNAVSVIKILRHFYSRIKSEKEFYTAVMGSIAGLVSSPAFSVYAASKAAVCRFIESVNAELKVGGYDNCILNVSPGSIKGTKFHGGENDPSLTEELASNIVEKMLERFSCVYIPEYEEIGSCSEADDKYRCPYIDT